MGLKQNRGPYRTADIKTTPFESAEEAWFWFILAQQARAEGARIAAGSSHIVRPCEPLDILNILSRLHRNRRLIRDHLLVLRHYGRRQSPPDPKYIREMRAHTIWTEALERLEAAFVSRGIVVRPHWAKEAGSNDDDFGGTGNAAFSSLVALGAQDNFFLEGMAAE